LPIYCAKQTLFYVSKNIKTNIVLQKHGVGKNEQHIHMFDSERFLNIRKFFEEEKTLPPSGCLPPPSLLE